MNAKIYVRPFTEISADQVALVGGKNASLGEMVRELAAEGVRVPGGFATLADAYWLYLKHNNLDARITDTLDSLDVSDTRALAKAGASIRGWIVDGQMPEELVRQISDAYRDMEKDYGPEPDVAVRSSATAEDLPDASFAGQQETYLNVKGVDHLLRTCKQVFASLFTDRAISYREHKGFGHMKVALSIGVQKMVRSDLGASGVIFTIDTETGFRELVLITAAYGLGETVVQGAVNPDEFLVYKSALKNDLRPILRRQLGEKAIKMIYSKETVTGPSTRTVTVRQQERERFAISDDDVLKLAEFAVAIEKHYSQKAGRLQPMDIEWAKDGETGELFVVQARPETVHGRPDALAQDTFALKEKGKVLITGKSIGSKIGAGAVRIIMDASHMHELQPGEVLVTDMTDPDWEPVMKVASAVVTNRGGRVCHAAIIARELGIPAVVGSGQATQMLHNGDPVTVSCAEGEVGKVYAGELEFERKHVDVEKLPKPNTKIMLIVGNPGQAFGFSALPNDGVGLARIEFIINNFIGVHPQALLEFDQQSPEVKEKIRQRMLGYQDPAHFYVDRLSEGIGSIAAAFYPKPVIIRTSDFKSNEYAALLGGERYEPKEENPMLGFRGASRYYSDSFIDCFALECRALKKVRDEMGFHNVEIMLPFVRSVDEVIRVNEILAQHGLKRGENGLRLILMCEIPANALLADQFLEHCDGFSIGSNDLTQLTLGVDRDSGLLAQFDERNDALKTIMAMAIEACRRHNKYIGICGQAPSDYPEITQWLIEQGITSVALNPDSVVRMTEIAYEAEQKLKRNRKH
ncbi:phosphoenolpyruvate synthase [Gilvimarinus sp. F26214L]|uniref:phosphoenolpyruvate synthase n=1 Tax=Gilvimarinus sp. DZF01 TaxID=3461371 RepID=UPI00404552E1